MNLPRCEVLVASANLNYCQTLANGLNAALGRLANPHGLSAVAALQGQPALASALAQGLVQLVLVDLGFSEATEAEALDTAHRLAAARPELSVYLLLGRPEAAGWRLTGQLAGQFNRDELDHGGWARILLAELAEKADTPFYDQLRDYVAQAKDSWHTPGHAGGDAYKGSPWVGDFREFVGEEMLRADLSVSVPMLDSLLHPTGVIAHAQRLAAQAFGARATFFATNGTSTANKVILQTLLVPGDVLLLDRNCHKSVHHAVILSGARPVYLDASVNRHHGLFGPVPKARLMQAMQANPHAKVLILTCSTYDGLSYDLQPIIEAAHARGIKVVVDEAWSGHARFHPHLRPTALECGADYATQSTHKVLSAFSQASMIHVNDPGFDAHLFRENFNMHASTSPQYALIASLDVARKQAVMEGYSLLSRSLQHAQELRERINETGAFKVLEVAELLADEVRGDGIRLDPTKLTVDIAASGYTADELRELLIERFNIQIEKNTHNTLTFLLTMATTRSKVARLIDAMQRLARERRTPLPAWRMPEVPAFTRLACLPRDAFYEAGERLGLQDETGGANPALVGRVCCDQVVPYPPGIPVLVPGQVVDEAVLQYLVRLLQTQRSIDVHGLPQEQGRWLMRVLSAAEHARLGL